MANKVPYALGFFLHILSFVLCSIAYGTGYWYEADDERDGEGRLFQRLGE